MRIIIIGAVAAGTSAAAKARRNNENAEIVIYEKDRFISYSGCGMPYYIGGEVGSAEELTPRNPAFFKNKYNVDIKTLHEVIAIHPDERSVQVKDMTTGKVFFDVYDKLVIATGATAVVPPNKRRKSGACFYATKHQRHEPDQSIYKYGFSQNSVYYRNRIYRAGGL